MIRIKGFLTGIAMLSSLNMANAGVDGIDLTLQPIDVTSDCDLLFFRSLETRFENHVFYLSKPYLVDDHKTGQAIRTYDEGDGSYQLALSVYFQKKNEMLDDDSATRGCNFHKIREDLNRDLEEGQREFRLAPIPLEQVQVRFEVDDDTILEGKYVSGATSGGSTIIDQGGTDLKFKVDVPTEKILKKMRYLSLNDDLTAKVIYKFSAKSTNGAAKINYSFNGLELSQNLALRLDKLGYPADDGMVVPKTLFESELEASIKELSLGVALEDSTSETFKEVVKSLMSQVSLRQALVDADDGQMQKPEICKTQPYIPMCQGRPSFPPPSLPGRPTPGPIPPTPEEKYDIKLALGLISQETEINIKIVNYGSPNQHTVFVPLDLSGEEVILPKVNLVSLTSGKDKVMAFYDLNNGDKLSLALTEKRLKEISYKDTIRWYSKEDLAKSKTAENFEVIGNLGFNPDDFTDEAYFSDGANSSRAFTKVLPTWMKFLGSGILGFWIDSPANFKVYFGEETKTIDFVSTLEEQTRNLELDITTPVEFIFSLIPGRSFTIDELLYGDNGGLWFADLDNYGQLNIEFFDELGEMYLILPSESDDEIESQPRLVESYEHVWTGVTNNRFVELDKTVYYPRFEREVTLSVKRTQF